MLDKVLLNFYEITPKWISNNLMTIVENIFYNRDYVQKYDRKLKQFIFLFNNGIEIQSHYRIYRQYSRELKYYLEHYNIKKGDIIIDAGAYVGSFSLYASKLVGENGRIISFEPDPEVFNKLLKNIELNKAKNIIAINKGLSSHQGFERFIHYGDATQINFEEEKSNNQIVSLPVVSLDYILENMGYDTVNFIKMDIEGAEIEALKGAKKLLRKNNIEMAIASYHIVNDHQSFIQVEKELQNYGFNCETKNLEHLTTYAYKI